MPVLAQQDEAVYFWVADNTVWALLVLCSMHFIPVFGPSTASNGGATLLPFLCSGYCASPLYITVQTHVEKYVLARSNLFLSHSISGTDWQVIVIS